MPVQKRFSYKHVDAFMMYLRTQFNIRSSNDSLVTVNKRKIKYRFQKDTI
jgi:hypothetical protein